MKNYVCGICKKEYENLDDYLECVFKCGKKIKAEQKEKEEKERLEKVNADLNKIKAAKEYYDGLLDKFKEEYPAEYQLNFGEKHKCSNDICKCSKADAKSEAKSEAKNGKAETIELTYEDNGKDKPKLSAKVNGKNVDEKTLDSLFDDPDTRYIAKMLGLL